MNEESSRLPIEVGSSEMHDQSLINLTQGRSSALSNIINSSLDFLQTDKSLTIREPQPGEEREYILTPKVTIIMCWVPPGEFLMGSPVEEMGHGEDETQHRVQITSGFWMTKYPIIQIQWHSIMFTNLINKKHVFTPATQANWNEISGNSGFIEKINKLIISGSHFLLPTEAQWEYACRAGTTSSLNNGRELTSKIGECMNLDEVAWYRNSNCKTALTVGLKKANAWGIHDMHGYKWEWCQDWYGPYSTEEAVDPCGPETGKSRVMRGGGSTSHPANCRSARRSLKSPNKSGCGFRLIRHSIHSVSEINERNTEWIGNREYVHDVKFLEQKEFSFNKDLSIT